MILTGKIRCFWIFLTLLINISCKKDKLKDEQEILVGEWEWFYTNTTYEICNPPSYDSIVNPSNFDKNYHLQIEKKGRVHFIEDSSQKSSFNLQLVYFSENTTYINYDFEFSIYLDGEQENQISGFVGIDSMVVVKGLPFPDTDCDNYTSYFVRE
ncbi:MAG: hypothetical protein WDZ35_10865 [Crocinitomicaceae bacterium]